MMHQNVTLSVYRNTLNRTQGFTMDTQLTFRPLHLQQWMTWVKTFSGFFVAFSSYFNLFLNFFFINGSCPITFETSRFRMTIERLDKLLPWSYFSLFYKHNMYRNSTENRYVFWIQVVPLLPTVTYTAHFIIIIIIFNHNKYYIIHKSTKVGSKYGVGMHKTTVLWTQTLYRRIHLYLQWECVFVCLSVCPFGRLQSVKAVWSHASLIDHNVSIKMVSMQLSIPRSLFGFTLQTLIYIITVR